jgi:hypothetical protein
MQVPVDPASLVEVKVAFTGRKLVVVDPALLAGVHWVHWWQWIWLRWEQAGSGVYSFTRRGETGFPSGIGSRLSSMEGFHFARNSISAFAKMKLVRVLLYSLVTVDLASNAAVYPAWLRVGSGVEHSAY